MKLDMEIGLGPGDIVLDGDPASTKRGTARPPPHFSADVYCGQMIGWIKTAVATAVDLGPGHIMLDGSGDPAPRKGAQQPPFSTHVCCGQTVAHLSYC